MNRTEQKERLTDIITKIEDTISAVKNDCEFVEEVVSDYSALLEKLNSEGFDTDSIIQQSEEGFTSSIIEAILTNKGNIEEVQDDIRDFKEDINSYADEVSESRAEKLNERYINLDEVHDKVYFLTVDDELTIDGVTETLQDCVEYLKEMKK